MRIDGDFKKNVKKIFWIGGSTKGVGNMLPGMEFNAFFDPAANFVCFNETGPLIVMAPWELFLAGQVSVDWRKNVLGKIASPQMEFLNKIEEKSLSSGSMWVSADSKTLALAINPKIITKQNNYYVEFVWEGDKSRGLTLVDYAKFTGKEPNAIVIEGLNVEGYKEMCLKYFATKLP